MFRRIFQCFILLFYYFFVRFECFFSWLRIWPPRCFIRSDLFADLNLSFLAAVEHHSLCRTTNRRQEWQLRSQEKQRHQYQLLPMLNLPLPPDNPIIQSNFLPQLPSSSAHGAQNERKEGRRSGRTDERTKGLIDGWIKDSREWQGTGGGIGGWLDGRVVASFPPFGVVWFMYEVGHPFSAPNTSSSGRLRRQSIFRRWGARILFLWAVHPSENSTRLSLKCNFC